MKTFARIFECVGMAILAALLLPLYLAFLTYLHGHELYLRMRYGEQYEDSGDV